MSPKTNIEYFDIAFNILDDMYDGKYNGKKAHENDLKEVLKRAKEQNVQIMATGTSLPECRKIVKMNVPCTVGVHPTQSKRMRDTDLNELIQITKTGIKEGNVRAWGELGLDYDRLHWSPKDIQLSRFREQMDAREQHFPQLPMFLHSRAAHDDFISIITQYSCSGVVHSFTGSKKELQDYLDLGFYIGINGCSLKTEEQVALVHDIPLDRLMLETDAPWCSIRPSHASSKYINTKNSYAVKDKYKYESGKMVKGRNEPCQIREVAEVVAGILGKDLQEVCHEAFTNAVKLFGSQSI